MGRGWPWYGRVPARCLHHHVSIAALRRDGPAEPGFVDLPVGPARAADPPSGVSAATGPTAPAAPVGRFWLARPGGAGYEASGRDDERGDVFGGLTGDLGMHRGVGICRQHDAGV